MNENKFTSRTRIVFFIINKFGQIIRYKFKSDAENKDHYERVTTTSLVGNRYGLISLEVCWPYKFKYVGLSLEINSGSLSSTLQQHDHNTLWLVRECCLHRDYLKILIAFSSCGSLPLCNALKSNGTSTSGGNPIPS